VYHRKKLNVGETLSYAKATESRLVVRERIGRVKTRPYMGFKIIMNDGLWIPRNIVILKRQLLAVGFSPASWRGPVGRSL
jgi:hypothetical protein